jgi:hypothetical protein
MPFMIKPIRASKLNKLAIFESLYDGLEDIGKGMVKDFEKTTKTWKGAKPKFEFTSEVEPPGAALFVGPAGDNEGTQKYEWLNDGTRKNYPIPKFPKKGGKRLAFMTTGFSPKTRVRTIGSTAGSKAGPPMAFPVQVIHPGIEARKFDETIGEIWNKPFKKAMELALKRGVKKSGHALASV